MQIIELETMIDTNGNIQFPSQYQLLYGQQVRLMVLPNAKPQEELTTFFSRFNADLTHYRFNREEANER